MAREYMVGKMEASTMESGFKTRLMDAEDMNGLMEEATRVNGKIVISMAKEYLLGKMGNAMKENISTIK
jgi:hypothetical protein